MTVDRFRAHRARTLPAAMLAVALLWLPNAASAQDQGGGGNNGNFLDNIFKRGGDSQQPAQREPGQGEAQELTTRIDRIEGALRQLTGTLEQLQYKNQQLELQLKRMQDDTDYRLQALGSKGAPARNVPAQQGQQAPSNLAPPPVANTGRRSDVFDPNAHPNAPGAPHELGNPSVAMPQSAAAENPPPVGAPGGRAAGQPLDISTMGNAAASPPPGTVPVTAAPNGLPPPRNAGAPGPQLATLPPSATPKDEYDLAYGYVLHKDYALAEQAFRDFLAKYPNERLVPDAQYWLGESMYQRQRYREAAESFLAVSTKFEKSGKAPDSLLRLGQSLAAMKQKEAACATLAEVGRKYPRASASVKRGVTQEQKREHC